MFRRVWRHRKKASFVFLLILAGAVLLAVFLPKTYHSEGKLLVRLGRENATLDSTATMGQEPVVSVPQSREAEMNSIVEVVHSRGMLEKVVDALGPAAVLGTAEPTADRERAVQALSRQVAVAPARRSNVIAISCLGPSPEWSQAVVAKLMDLYRVEHSRMNRTRGSLEFFAEQAARAQQELAVAEKAFQDFRTATGVVSPADQRKALAERVCRIEDELLSAESERAVCAAKVQHLRQEIGHLPQRQVAAETQGLGNEGTDRMREQLYALEVKREEAAAKYTPDHPAMQQVEEQLAAARDVFNHQSPTRTQVTTAKNPVVEQAEEDAFRQDHALATCQARIDAIRAQLGGARQALESFNANEMESDRLHRQLELKQASYRTYATNLEQARIDEAMVSERISNISVAQAASYEPKAVRPNKLGVLAAGLLLALLGAVTAAWTCESADHRLRRPEDVEQELDLPLLGSIPAMPPQELVLTAAGNGNGHAHRGDGQ
jgi:uncharacterized protein involved in exopolysaccharide biosynthesis